MHCFVPVWIELYHGNVTGGHSCLEIAKNLDRETIACSLTFMESVDG
jgi:hypothetical protein